MNKENLLKLADWLEANIKQEQFDMHYCRADENGFAVDYIDRDDCGSIGCALGWAPFVPGLEPVGEEYIGERPLLSWWLYSWRVFRLEDCEWDFLFSQNWESIDNTPEGAVARIRWLVDDGNDIADLCGYQGQTEYDPCPKDLVKLMAGKPKEDNE